MPIHSRLMLSCLAFLVFFSMMGMFSSADSLWQTAAKAGTVLTTFVLVVVVLITIWS